MARYYFEEIESGQIREEYTVIEVVNHFAEIGNDDANAMLLAEKNGGVIEAKPDTSPLLVEAKPTSKKPAQQTTQEDEVTNG